MGQAVRHINHQTVLAIYAAQDPTRTATLRNRFASQMRKRFRRVRGLIWDAIVVKDVFGIAGGHGGIQVNVDSGLRPGQFNFPRVQDKTTAFMEWLNAQVDAEILEVSNRQRLGQSIDETWQNVFIEDTYKRGVQRANYEMRRQQFPAVQSIEAQGGMSVVMGMPMHVDRLGVLYTRAFSELKGITDAMDKQISQVLTQGLADGDGPRLLARKLSATIGGSETGGLGLTDTLGRFIPAQRRAEMLARTETIRAHHQGMMQEYRNWGIEGVQVQAEFRTAGDLRVCDECSALEGHVYTLEEAQDLIPVHPMCRCIVLPVRPGDVTSTGQRVEEVQIEEDYFIEAYEEKAEAFYARLSTDEKQAIEAYVGPGYLDINGELREFKGSLGYSENLTVRKQVRHIDSALKKGEVLERNLKVFRGIEAEDFEIIFPQGVDVGSVVSDYGYISTSVDKEMAQRFAGSDGWLIEINIQQGQRVAFINPGSNAKEVLLPRQSVYTNSQLRITNVDYDSRRITGTWIE